MRLTTCMVLPQPFAIFNPPYRTALCLRAICTHRLAFAEMASLLQLEVVRPHGEIRQVSVYASMQATAKQIGQPFVLLTTAQHEVMRPEHSMEKAGIKNGDSILAVIYRPQMAASSMAFAVWTLADYPILTCGHFWSSAVSEAKRYWNVQAIQATQKAFATILHNGRVSAWGEPDYGGCIEIDVDASLQIVRAIQATASAFAAVLADGLVVTWGDDAAGGDSASVASQLCDIQQIQASKGAFAAIAGDGSVITWGCQHSGGDSSSVTHRLISTHRAFAAMTDQGKVICWGHPQHGGDNAPANLADKKVLCIQSNPFAFAAVLTDEAVVAWGNADMGGDTKSVQQHLQTVQKIQATRGICCCSQKQIGSYLGKSALRRG